MPHRSFAAARISEQREPITFDFGLYSEETFTIVPDPSLGDTFDLYGLPEDLNPQASTYSSSVLLLTKFVRRMIKPEDRERFDRVLYKIPSTQSFMIVELAEWICGQVVPVPSQPPASS